MEKLFAEIDELFNSDLNQKLKLHPLGKKSKIMTHSEGMNILGIELRRNNLILGKKTKSKIEIVKNALTKNLDRTERSKYKQKRRALFHYKQYIETM